ncbi:MAG: rRNA maturation RNase YbeY [Lysobacterales bacterium]
MPPDSTAVEATLELLLGYGCGRRGIPAPRSYARWAQSALSAAGCRGHHQLSLRVVDADEGLALNRDYRGKAYATNVLSFPADALIDDGQTRLLGDIALCAPVVAREAAEQGKTLQSHHAHLCVHGVLHLLGYDHEDSAAAEVMEAIEIQAMQRLGFANPYETTGPSA